MFTDKFAIFGGTFDPMHNGHLQIANLIIQNLQFNKVIFTPNHTQLLRNQALASPEQRCEMLKLATTDNKKFSINLNEIDRQGPSYTIDTVKHLSASLGQNTSTTKNPNLIWLVLGLDAFYNLPDWHNYEELTELCNFIIINRQLPTIQNQQHTHWAQKQLQQHQDKFIFLEISAINISSTQIRGLLQQKNFAVVKQLVPEKVFNYIIENKLYQ